MEGLNKKIKECKYIILTLRNCKNPKGVYEHDLANSKIQEAIDLLEVDLERMKIIGSYSVSDQDTFTVPSLFKK